MRLWLVGCSASLLTSSIFLHSLIFTVGCGRPCTWQERADYYLRDRESSENCHKIGPQCSSSSSTRRCSGSGTLHRIECRCSGYRPKGTCLTRGPVSYCFLASIILFFCPKIKHGGAGAARPCTPGAKRGPQSSRPRPTRRCTGPGTLHRIECRSTGNRPKGTQQGWRRPTDGHHALRHRCCHCRLLPQGRAPSCGSGGSSE